MFYHDQYNEVVSNFKESYIAKGLALMKLWAIEKEAYSSIPDAEPDGDITYASACAAEKIDNIEKRLTSK